MLTKPYSQACENNKTPILQILKKTFTQSVIVLEIGSGTGQHACYFASQLPYLNWQPSDRAENIAGILMWRQEAQLPNLLSPYTLDVEDTMWPLTHIEALFTANTLHIMSMKQVQIFFQRIGVYLNNSAKICIYGPFNYNGKYISESNANFDHWLKQRDSLSGIKHFEDILTFANDANCKLIADESMPANNRLLILQKT
jgi:hypothetical protein